MAKKKAKKKVLKKSAVKSTKKVTKKRKASAPRITQEKMAGLINEMIVFAGIVNDAVQNLNGRVEKIEAILLPSDSPENDSLSGITVDTAGAIYSTDDTTQYDFLDDDDWDPQH